MLIINILELLKNYKNNFLKASSLLESVIAISVISICILIAAKIYAQLLGSSYSYRYLQAISKIDNLFYEAKATQNFEAKDIKFKNYFIKKEVENKNENLKVLKYSVFHKNDTIIKKYYLNK